jgi:hypothetical protein
MQKQFSDWLWVAEPGEITGNAVGTSEIYDIVRWDALLRDVIAEIERKLGPDADGLGTELVQEFARSYLIAANWVASLLRQGRLDLLHDILGWYPLAGPMIRRLMEVEWRPFPNVPLGFIFRLPPGFCGGLALCAPDEIPPKYDQATDEERFSRLDRDDQRIVEYWRQEPNAEEHNRENNSELAETCPPPDSVIADEEFLKGLEDL